MTRRARPWTGTAAALLALAAGGCGLGAVGQAQREIAAGNLEAGTAELERERERSPRSVDVRVALGEAYYRIARDALDRERDEARYLTYLERALGEFLTAVELDPRDERPHFYLGVMEIYRGKPQRALRSFATARRLRPESVFAYTNIAETYVYLGRLESARRWNELGLRKNAPYGAVQLNDMLIAWREGDLDVARTIFADLRRSDPDTLRTINVAPLPETPQRFEDFAGYCCDSPACGPYLADACRELSLEVRERELSEDAVRRELVLEMEKQRRLRRVYEQRKELDVEIEDDSPEP